MKTASQIMLAINLVTNIIAIILIATMPQALYADFRVYFIVCIIYAVIGIIFDVITLFAIINAVTSEQLRIWGILDIFFCGILCGVFVLCIKDYEL